ncbi:unnamed protein product, partial [Mesorhabditis belari]|uniref:Uncharacterized protein n=1 Tax=Mesorhabditis belari TaxID=2138241 RepID=A0AAF3JB80_9BILA
MSAHPTLGPSTSQKDQLTIEIEESKDEKKESTNDSTTKAHSGPTVLQSDCPPRGLPPPSPFSQSWSGATFPRRNKERAYKSIMARRPSPLAVERRMSPSGSAGSPIEEFTPEALEKDPIPILRRDSSTCSMDFGPENDGDDEDESRRERNECEDVSELPCFSPISSPIFPHKHKNSAQMSDDGSMITLSESVISYGGRPGELTIDDSCFDLLNTSTENSASNTPIEKVFPRIFGEDYSNVETTTINSEPTTSKKEEKEDIRRRCESICLPRSETLPCPPDNTLMLRAKESARKISVRSIRPSSVPSEAILMSREDSIFPGFLNENNDGKENEPSSGTSSSAISIGERKRSMRRKGSNEGNPLQPKGRILPLQSIPAQTVLEKPNPLTPPEIAERKIWSNSLPGRQVGDLRVIEMLRVKVFSLKGLRGASQKPVYILGKLDSRDVFQSAAIPKSSSEDILEEFTYDVSSPFNHLHLVVVEAARVGKPARPIGRVSIKRKDLMKSLNKEQSFPLRVVSKFSDVQGQICVDIRRMSNSFSLRVVDISDLSIRDTSELFLLVKCEEGAKEGKRLRIGGTSDRGGARWLHMDCPREGTLSIKMSLWNELLKGLNTVFHGQVRVDVDDRWTNGSKWFYLRPKQSDQEKAARKEQAGLGEMKLWVSYTADHVLPLTTYQPLLNALLASTKNEYRASTVALLEHLPQLDLGALGKPLVQIFAHSGDIRTLLQILYQQEITKCQDINTLFRSQSLASRMLFELMKTYGHQYLHTTLKPVIDKIYSERKSCEIDPSRIQNGDSLEKNTKTLLGYFSLCFDRIVESSPRCPLSLRTIFADLRKTVSQEASEKKTERLAQSSFLIMRFFAAALLNPKSFGLKREQPDSKVSRTLVLLSKVLQRVANECVASHALIIKESWLEPILKQVTNEEHKNAMVLFLDRVALQIPDSQPITDNLAAIKEGYLVESRPRTGPRWSLIQQPKKRFVYLTEESLCWQKSRRGGVLDQKGMMSLSSIEKVLPGERATFTVWTSEKQVGFEAASAMEMKDWVTEIERQRLRRDPKGASLGEELCVMGNADVERALEEVHLLLVEHADTLVQWRNALEIPSTSQSSIPSLPHIFDLKENPVTRQRLFATLDTILAVTYAIETVHREAVSKYMNHIRHGTGTRENPIGDENYLLLKRKFSMDP